MVTLAVRRRAWASLGRAGAVVLALTMLLALLPSCGAASTTKPAHPLVGQPFTFALPDLAGKTVRPEQFRGRVVLVDLWATWCKPCALSLPIYAELSRELSPQGLTVVGISIDEDDEVLRGYLTAHPLPFPILRDPEQILPARIKAEAMPTLVLLGRDGRVVYVHSSFREGEEAVIEQEIRRALAAPGAPSGE
jgi:thiol-disulfide isomerase/thioredoxin